MASESLEPSQANRFGVGAHFFEAPAIETALYIVSTPIGNLGDITVRALETLAGVATIACEDTRITSKLTQRYSIKTSLLAYHEHNSDKQRPKILELLENQKPVALVSDAGTPLVSDPGYRLIQDVLSKGHKVIPIPGASASLAALVGSGLPSDTFIFAGFLPQKNGPKARRLDEFKDTPATVIFFESPHRLSATLAIMCETFGKDRYAVVARELTKKFETFERETLEELTKLFAENRTKGEIVILVGPNQSNPDASAEDIDALLQSALSKMPVSAAAKHVSKLTGSDRNTIYKRALEIKDR